MPIFFPTLNVRKTGKCHRGAWKAGWQFPDVTRQELNLRGMPIFFPTLHVRKTGKCLRGAWKAGWQFPDVTRQELNLRGMPIFFPTLYVRKTGRENRAKSDTQTNRKGHRGAGIELSKIVLGLMYPGRLSRGG